MSKLPQAPFLYAITNRDMAGEDDIEKIVADLCAGGARVIQLREKGLSTADLTELAIKATETAHRYGALMIINDRADVALYAKADGVHLGDDDISAAEARKVLGQQAIIGISCHSQEDVQQAASQPIDYFAVGPIYPTDTKLLKYGIVGTELIKKVRTICPLPLVAIGGIGPDKAAEVIAAGADGIAVIGAVMLPGKIADASREFISKLR